MELQNQTVFCIKIQNDLWDSFNTNVNIKSLPKRIDISLLEEGILGHQFDTKVEPSKRNPKFYKDIANWATHLFCLGKFLKEHDTEWLLVIESTIDLEVIDKAKPGITLFDERAKSYLIDRTTAQSVVDNSLIYYDSFRNTLEDLKNLELININNSTQFKKIGQNPFYIYLPFILLFIASILIIAPFYSELTKNFIRLTKMARSKETMVSR